MAGLEFIGGEKGGVGKSVLARVVAQYLIDHNQPFIGFDTDRSHTTFSRFYGDFASPTVIEDYSSLDRLIEALDEVPGRRVVVDLAAQTMPPLNRWLDDSGVLGLLAENGTSTRFWHVMDDGMDSIALLDDLLATHGASFQAGVGLVIVLNHGRGSNFADFQASSAKTAALALGARIVELRGLHEASMRKIDRHNSSFWAAIHHRGGEQALGLLERQRVKTWLAKTYADLAPLLGAST